MRLRKRLDSAKNNWRLAKPTLAQLWREYRYPLALAIAWVSYSIWDQRNTSWTVSAAVNLFVTSMFFISQYTAQWFRVRKQQGVEGGLNRIEARVEEAVRRLNFAADAVVGGASFCYIWGVPDQGRLAITSSGEHPMYDVSVRITDMNWLRNKPRNMWTKDEFDAFMKPRPLGTFPANISGHLPFSWPFATGNTRLFNLEFVARNGVFCQWIKFELVGGCWESALKVLRDDVVVFQTISGGFPQQRIEDIEW